MLPENTSASSLIASAYEAVGDMGKWAEVLRRFQTHIGADVLIQLDARASQGAIQGTSLSSDQHVFGLDLARAEQYAALAPESPIAPKVVRIPVGTLAADQTLMPRRQFERSQFFDQWVRPNRMTEALIGPLTPVGPGMIVLNVMRAAGSRHSPFAEQDPAIMAVLPHLGRALILHRRFREAERVPTRMQGAILDAIATAMLCFGTGGRLLWMNEACTQLLASRDGLCLGQENRLIASHPASDFGLQRLFHLVAHGVGGATSIARPSGGLPFALTATPLGVERQEEWRAEAALPCAPIGLLAITQPEKPFEENGGEGIKGRLRALYGLTEAEAIVAVAVVRTGGLPGAAEALGLSRSTIHTHLRHVFSKMHVKGQPELAGRLEALSLLK